MMVFHVHLKILNQREYMMALVALSGLIYICATLACNSLTMTPLINVKTHYKAIRGGGADIIITEIEILGTPPRGSQRSKIGSTTGWHYLHWTCQLFLLASNAHGRDRNIFSWMIPGMSRLSGLENS